jgi:preprotein translocase subunit SecG
MMMLIIFIIFIIFIIIMSLILVQKLCKIDYTNKLMITSPYPIVVV